MGFSLAEDALWTAGGTGQGSGRKGIGTAAIEFQRDEVSLRHYPDDEGQWNLQLPAGSYQMRIMDQGRSELVQTVNIEADQVMDVSPTMGQASQIHFDGG